MTAAEQEQDVPFDDPPASTSAGGTAGPAKNGTNGTHESFETATPVRISKEVMPRGAESTTGPSERRAGPITPAPRAAGALRELPHSLEVETGLLGSCFVDPQKVVQQAIVAGIRPESYYDTGNGIIFRVLCTLHAAKTPIDTVIVSEELKRERFFDGQNVYVKVMEVSGATATTAQAEYFIEQVRALALRREIIRTTTSVVEDAYDTNADIREFVQSIDLRMNWTERAGVQQSVLQRLEQSQYCLTRRVTPSDPVMSLGDVVIFRRGNIASLTAQSKSGKSSFMSGLIAATFLDPDHGGDCFSANGLNGAGQAVLHFDTEQAPEDHQAMMDITMRRAGAESLPGWLKSYSRKGVNATQLRHELEVAMTAAARAHGGIRIVFLDGIADFINDVNDAQEVNPFISWLESMAVQHNCSIVCVLHLNPIANRQSIEKARGHLGSQLQRKGETDLRLRKDDNGVTAVFTDPMGTRKAPILEKDGIRFCWSQDDRMHVSCKTAAFNPKDEAKRERLRELMAGIVEDEKTKRFRYADLIRAITKAAGVSPSTAEDKYSLMKKLGVISKDLMGYWSLSEA